MVNEGYLAGKSSIAIVRAKLKRKEESDIDDCEIETSPFLVYIFTLPTISFLVSMVAKEIAIVKRGISEKGLVF